MDRPLLLIDIDGVISLFGFDRHQPPPGRLIAVDGILHYVSTAAGESLLELATHFELVWCSGWEEKADEHLPLALGLPAGLPHVGLSGGSVDFDRQPDPGRRHWKLAAIDRYAGADRALAWIDDAHDETCRAWALARPGPTLLIGTDPAIGLTDRHASELTAWARQLGTR